MIQHLQRHPFLKWVAYFAIWTLISLAFAGQAYLTRAEIGSPVSWGFALAGNLVDWYTFDLLFQHLDLLGHHQRGAGDPIVSPRPRARSAHSGIGKASHRGSLAGVAD